MGSTLQQARAILEHIRCFHVECCSKPKRSFLVPEACNSARRWQIVLNYKGESCSDVKAVIEFRNAGHAPGVAVPRTSRLDDGFLKSKVAIAFHGRAETFVASIEIVQELEASVDSVEKLGGVMRAMPLADVASDMNLDKDHHFNELALYIFRFVLGNKSETPSRKQHGKAQMSERG